MGNPDAERDFIFAGDAAKIFVRSLAERGRTDSYNLAFGSTISIRRLADAALKAAGRTDKRVVVNAPKSAGVNIRKATAARIRKDFAPAPFVDIDRGLAATIDWYRHALGL